MSSPRDGSRIIGSRRLLEARRIAEILREETVGGILLLGAAVIALVWANSAWSHSYEVFVDYRFGPEALHLHLSDEQWAADGLLAIFFFVAGLELKREFVAGDLRDPRRAALPVAAAVGGVVVPALLYTLINLGSSGHPQGWAIPTATDIAFALAVLAVIGSALPAALRTFLLTLAVVDDMIAITIIALFYTEHLKPLALIASLVPLAIFGILVQRRITHWWLLIPLAAATWTLVHYSGVHATVAGVLLAFTVPVLRNERDSVRYPAEHSDPEDDGHDAGLAETIEHGMRPLSSAFAVPVFALVSAGVPLGGLSGLQSAMTDRVAIGVVVGLVVGKTIGVFGSTWLVAKFTHAQLDPGLAWADIVGMSVLCGVGFTVSLLIGTLAFGNGTPLDNHSKVAVLVGSVLAAVLAAIILRLRNSSYRRMVPDPEA